MDGSALGPGGIFGYGQYTSKHGISSFETTNLQNDNTMPAQDEDDLDEDSLNITNVKQHITPSPNVPTDCWQSKNTAVPSSRDKNRLKNSEDIRINHKDADDRELGDSFGAKLDSTDYNFQGKLFRQHIFIDVEPSSPAKELGLMSDGKTDELVLLNGVFVPELTRKQVYSIFWKLPVDGRTTLTLVVRRIESKEKFQWIQFSCILVADEKEPKYRLPECQDVKEKTLDHGPEKEFIIKLKLGGRYLCVDNHCVCLKKITGQKVDQETDLVLFAKKRLQVANKDKPGYEWITALKAPDPSHQYIGPNLHLAVTLLPEEHWYNYKRDSNGIYLIHKDPERGTFYLGCQGDEVMFTTARFLCQVFEVKQDEVDGSDGLTVSSLYSF